MGPHHLYTSAHTQHTYRTKSSRWTLHHPPKKLCIHVYMCRKILLSMHTHVLTHKISKYMCHVSIYTFICTCVHIHQVIQHYTLQKLCIQSCIYIYIYMYIHTSIFIYTHTHVPAHKIHQSKHSRQTSTTRQNSIYKHIHTYTLMLAHTHTHKIHISTHLEQ